MRSRWRKEGHMAPQCIIPSFISSQIVCLGEACVQCYSECFLELAGQRLETLLLAARRPTPEKPCPSALPPAPEGSHLPHPRPRHNPSTRDPGPHSSKDPDQEAPGSFQGCWTLQDLCSEREENEGGRDDGKEPELVQLSAAAAARSISSLGPPASP